MKVLIVVSVLLSLIAVGSANPAGGSSPNPANDFILTVTATIGQVSAILGLNITSQPQCIPVAGAPPCAPQVSHCRHPYCVYGEILPNASDPSQFWGQCYFRVDSDGEEFAWAYFYIAPVNPNVTFTYFIDGTNAQPGQQVSPRNIKYEAYNTATGQLNGFNGYFPGPLPSPQLTSYMNIYANDNTTGTVVTTLAGVLPINRPCPNPS